MKDLLDDSDGELEPSAADMRKVNTTQVEMHAHPSFGIDTVKSTTAAGKRNFRQHQGGQANLKVSTMRRQDSTMIKRTVSMTKEPATELTPTDLKNASNELGNVAKKDGTATASAVGNKFSRSSSLKKE